MKVGDMVRHRFDGRDDELGIVLNIKRGKAHPSIGLVNVLWAPGCTHQRTTLRIRDLETVVEAR